MDYSKIEVPPFQSSMSRDATDAAFRDRKNLEPSISPIAEFLHPISLPCFPLAYYTLRPNQFAVILNCGVLTAVETEPGCHYHNMCGREIMYIDGAQISVDLAHQKILDRIGNPLICSAVVTYRVVVPAQAALGMCK